MSSYSPPDFAKMDELSRRSLRFNVEAKLDDPKWASSARQLLAALDAHEAHEQVAVADHVRTLPVAHRVSEAFTHEPMTETERKLVQVLLDNPGRTSSGLTQTLGWRGQAWHMHFGEMCKKREARLWPAEPAVTRDANFYCGILADLSEANTWTVKPDVADGLALLGLHPKRAD